MNFFYLIFSFAAAHAQIVGDNVLEDPMVSYRCKELIQERNAKVTAKQRLKSLIERNKKLVKKTPEYKKTTLSRFNASRAKLDMAFNESIIRIKEMEENIIRSGCPGINI